MVFETSLKDLSTNSTQALKQINNKTLKDLSEIIVESSFHLFFTNKNIPLMKLENIFLSKSDKNFILNLVMV